MKSSLSYHHPHMLLKPMQLEQEALQSQRHQQSSKTTCHKAFTQNGWKRLRKNGSWSTNTGAVFVTA